MKYHFSKDSTWEGYCFIKPIENLSIADYEKYFDEECISYDELCDIFSKGASAEKKVPAFVLKEEYFDEVMLDTKSYALGKMIDNLISFDMGCSIKCEELTSDLGMNAVFTLNDDSLWNEILSSDTGKASGNLKDNYLWFGVEDEFADMKIELSNFKVDEEDENIIHGCISLTCPTLGLSGNDAYFKFLYHRKEDKFDIEDSENGSLELQFDSEFENTLQDIRENLEKYLEIYAADYSELYTGR